MGLTISQKMKVPAVLVIKLIGRELDVSGNLTIMDGYAFQGGGIHMDELSTLDFLEPLVAPWLL